MRCQTIDCRCVAPPLIYNKHYFHRCNDSSNCEALIERFYIYIYINWKIRENHSSVERPSYDVF